MRLRWVAAALVTSGVACTGLWLARPALPSVPSVFAERDARRAVPTTPIAPPRRAATPVALAPQASAVVSASPLRLPSTSVAAAMAPPGNQPVSDPDVPDDDTPLIPTGPVLASILKESWIYAAPSFKAQKIGYLRAGAVVSRSEKPAAYGGCEKGWYKIQPRGFVCNGMSATLDVANPVTDIARRRPDRTQGLPYLYGMSKFPTPPFYLKLPSAAEQSSVEPDLAGHVNKAAKTREIASVRDQLDDIPSALLYGRVVPSVTPNHHGPGALYNGRAVPRSGFAMISRFEWEGRIWGLTTDLQIVPLDRMRVITPSSFHGVALGDAGLPVVFDRAHGDRYHKLDETTGGLTAAGPIGYREGIQLTGESKRIDGSLYWESRDGRWVHDSARLVKLDAPKEWPQWASEGKKWIDISILKQSLVAYEGTRPVYTTLVSTGADGLGDPKDTHSTVRGTFLIHTKHVTVTMDSDDTEDQFDLRDVPYVQYFHEGYALHAAYWHDEFGTPRSHGCVNLHPTDAAWLFSWTTPDVPAEWHGALSLKQGTVVYIHP